jgi:hypothetical protein
VGLNGTGYGRCDLRVDADGRPFMLEINPNCGVFYRPEDAGSADLSSARPGRPRGIHPRVVEAALRRHARGERNWEVRPTPGRRLRHPRTRSDPPGERMIEFEERPTTSSRSRTSSGLGRAAPLLVRELRLAAHRRGVGHVGRNPEDWKPVNHSCEPTAWLEGLDVVARLPLERGDEITLDYATFYNERMPSFECACGDPECRGVIRGDDYLRDFVSRYGDHVSDYVRRKRAGAR